MVAKNSLLIWVLLVPVLGLFLVVPGHAGLALNDNFTENAYIKNSVADRLGAFGRCVASGHLLAVQAPSALNVLVFRHEGGEWVEEACLRGSNTTPQDGLIATGLSGDTLVIGARGEDSSATGVNGDEADNSAPSAGAAYVFRRTNGDWLQEAYLKASNTDAFDGFGWSVAVRGDLLVVGAIGESSSANTPGGDQSDNSVSAAGAAYIFVRNGSTWTQDAYLKASNTDAADRFGSAVAIAGDRVIVGAPFESSPGSGVDNSDMGNGKTSSGAVYVFVKNGSEWIQEAYIKAGSSDAQDQFGSQIAADGLTLVVGAAEEDSGAMGVNGSEVDDSVAGSGAAYVFLRSLQGWTQQAYLKASNPGSLDAFGRSVAVNGHLVLVGASGEDSSGVGVNGDANNFATDAGAAYLFRRTHLGWGQVAYLKASNTNIGDRFGGTVAVTPEFLAVDAGTEDSGALGINGDQLDNSLSNSGAVYTFRPCGAEAGRSFCHGDGGDQLGCTDCPCGNNALPGSAGGCLNSVGRSAVLSATGATSSQRAECDLVLQMADASALTFALLVSGSSALPTSPSNPCFLQNPDSGIVSSALDGLRCVGTDFIRHGVRSTDVFGATTGGWTGASVQSNLPAQVAGQTRYFQGYYRDVTSGSCGAGVQTTNGLAITL